MDRGDKENMGGEVKVPALKQFGSSVGSQAMEEAYRLSLESIWE